jgi:hypothetical protein
MVERKVIVKLPSSVVREIEAASVNKKIDEARRVGDQLQTVNAIKAKQRVDMHFVVDPNVDPLSPTSRVVVIDPNGSFNETEYEVATPFSRGRID